MTSGNASRIASLVREWYRLVDKPIRETPSADIPAGERRQIARLLSEEHRELRRGLRKRDVIKVADALADLTYVAYGAAAQMGIDLDAVLEEVHQANMSKPNSDGTIVRARSGKVLKGDQYVGPDLTRLLRAGTQGDAPQKRRWWHRGG